MEGDTIVFIEPIVGLTTKPWTLMSLAWIANERDSVCLYRICDIDARNGPEKLPPFWCYQLDPLHWICNPAELNISI